MAVLGVRRAWDVIPVVCVVTVDNGEGDMVVTRGVGMGDGDEERGFVWIEPACDTCVTDG